MDGTDGTVPRRRGARAFVDGTAVAPAKGRAPARRPRPKAKPKRTLVRWSAAREEIFLATLGQTSNVAASIRASGLSETSVYRRRQMSEDFRARWAAALREGFAKLEAMLLDRALNGVEKPVWHGGKQVGTMIEYSDRLALALLSAHRGSVLGIGREPAPVPVDELRARLAARLGQMNRRMGGEG